jgi:hypothetical protein
VFSVKQALKMLNIIYLHIPASKALSKFSKFVNKERTDSITLQLVSSRIVKKKDKWRKCNELDKEQNINIT